MMNSKHFLLIAGEDGALLVPPEGKGTTVYATGHNEASSAKIIEELKKHRSVPVIIIADVLAQEIRHEQLPPVRFFDRKNLLARRLKQAFPDTTLCGCVINEKTTAVLAGINENSPATLWSRIINSTRSYMPTICMLPIECCGLATALGDPGKREWSLLISWQRTGGLRQIVTKNGLPFFTRLTPPLPFDANAKEIASTVSHDINATLDYLARLGLKDKSQITIIALLPEHAHKAVQAIDVATNEIEVMTPYQAAQLLELDFTPAPDDQTSDILFAAWFMKQPRIRFKLMRPEDKKKATHLNIKRCGTIAATLTWLVVLIMFAVQLGDIFSEWKNYSTAKSSINSLQQQLAQEQNRLGPATEPLGRLREALTRKRIFSSNTPDPWTELQAIAQNTDESIRVLNFEWQEDILSFTIQLDATNASLQEIAEKFNKYTEKLQQFLQQTDVSYSLQVLQNPSGENPAEAISSNGNAPLSTARIAIRRAAP